MLHAQQSNETENKLINNNSSRIDNGMSADTNEKRVLFFGCDFCAENFTSRWDRKEHTFTHFLSKLCSGCSSPLVKIADDWYGVHNEQLCIEKIPNDKTTIEVEPNFLHVQIKSEESNIMDCENIEMNNLDDAIKVESTFPNDLWECSSSSDENFKSENAHFDVESRTKTTEYELTIDTSKLNQINGEANEEQKSARIPCKICAKPLLSVSLKNHMKVIHKIVPPKSVPADKNRVREKPICTVCGRTFSSNGNLGKHMNIHTGRKYVCDICGRAYSQSDHLRDHMNTHAGRKPHKCQFCPKVFARRVEVKAHTRTHTGEKPYKCNVDQCERAFTYEIDLKRHKFGTHGIYHKQHPCSTCGKIFPENKLLRKHLQSHADRS